MNKNLVVGIIVGIIAISLLAAAFLTPDKAGKAAGNGKIGLIRIEGEITGSSGDSGFFGGSASGQTIMEQLKRAREDDSIKAVLIRINSPGGSSAASQEIGEEIEKVRKAGKIVVASMGDVAASGGYWIAAKTDKIIADPATMTGSIGVIMDLQNMKELYDKIGITPETIKSGPYKDMGSSSRPLTPAERNILQTMVNDIYQQFVDVVSEGRKMDRAKVLSLADGRVFTGRQAKESGLIDELGNYYDAVKLTGRLAGIKGEPEVYELNTETPFEKIFGEVNASTGLKNINNLSAQELQLIFSILNNKQPLLGR